MTNNEQSKRTATKVILQAMSDCCSGDQTRAVVAHDSPLTAAALPRCRVAALPPPRHPTPPTRPNCATVAVNCGLSRRQPGHSYGHTQMTTGGWEQINSPGDGGMFVKRN